MSVSDEELKRLEKQVKKSKRIASELAAQLHDLVEDQLPAGFETLPGLADQTYRACQDWDQARKALANAQANTSAAVGG